MNNNENRKSAAKQINLKHIPGFEGYYKISEQGEVYSIRQSKFLKPRMSQDGYKRVALCVDGKRYEHRVARLVAMTYLDNPNNLPQVNHINFNTLDDYFSNLEWCTGEYNSKYSYEAGRLDGKVRGCNKIYTLTNIYNGKSFSIIGFKNLLKQLNISNSCKHSLLRNANTGKYITKGVLKGLRIDIDDLKVQRLSNDGVGSSESKCGTPE